MAVTLNSKGKSHANALVAGGKVNKSVGGWSFSSDDGNKILGDDNWAEYGKWFMGKDASQEKETKAYYKYPFGKNGKIFRSALIAIRQRSGQQDEPKIFNAAGTLIEKIDKEEDSRSNIAKIKELLGSGDSSNVEVRTGKAEFRVVRKEDGALPRIEGYAAVFGKDSEDMGFIERIASGAFKKALKISDARSLFNHDPNIVLGRQSAKTLELSEDKTGLFMSVQPPDTQLIRDMVLTPIERGDIKEQSFGFTIEADKWENLDSDKPIRTITKVREIFDTGPVTFPAYTDTSVALRSMKAAKEAPPELNKEEIDIVLKRDNGDDVHYLFENKEVFDEFMLKADELRSELNPTIPGSDNTDGDLTIKKPLDEVRDETLEKINATIERLKNEDD